VEAIEQKKGGSMIMEFGYEKGETCNRNGCNGILTEHDTENHCSCHISAPCSYCTDSRVYCPECGWDGREEQIEADKKASQTAKKYDVWKPRTINDLDKNKIDYICSSHTHFSMIKEGVFPKRTTMDEVREIVKGTFGGRFEMFDKENCKFKYVAYTD
jgi:hypothetical protein